MKRIVLLSLSMLLVVFIMPTHAGKPAPEIQCSQSAISRYFDIPAPNANELVTVLNVPEGEVFVLTDIAFTRVANNNTAFANLLEGETIKCSFLFEHPEGSAKSPTLHFNTGILFEPGSIVVLDTRGTWGKYFFSGYFTNCY